MQRLLPTLTIVLTLVNTAACFRSATPTNPIPECALATRLSAMESSTSPIVIALREKGYFDTVAAIHAAGGVELYNIDGVNPRTIFAPTEVGWTALATSLGYASTETMLCQMPAASIKAILQYNCLTQPRSASEIGAQKAHPSCLVQNFANAPLNIDNDPSQLAIRDAACTVIPVRYKDIRAGGNFIHGTDRPAVPPRVFPVVDMIRSNPFLNVEVAAFGTAPLDLLTELASVPSFTFFVPTAAGLESALVSIGPTDLGLTADQIKELLRYQIAAPAITLSSEGPVPSLATGQELTINTNGAPVVQTSVGMAFTTIPASNILQTNNVGSDGNNIYCVENVLYPRVAFCQVTPDTTTATQTCANAVSQADSDASTCAAITLGSTDGGISVQACAFTPPSCVVNLDNELTNCATYGNGDPINGTICKQYPAYCTWTAATPPATIGSCDPVGGSSTDADACAGRISRNNVTADRANCNSTLDPEFSMCTYVEGTCDPATDNNASNCASLVNSDCVEAATGPTQYNTDFCSLQFAPEET